MFLIFPLKAMLLIDVSHKVEFVLIMINLKPMQGGTNWMIYNQINSKAINY